ncbi:MAG: ABC transporter permease, partial [Candidatus Omnitrophica bacterium]|nr:ABC transporter permease [Candidatus Omnitrophota bacterium]
MDYIIDGLAKAFKIIFSLDKEFLLIVFTSLKCALVSTGLAALVGVPFGIVIGHKKFIGRQFIITVLNTLMSLPTVVVGLMVYSFLSRQGPLGSFGLLYTLTAMVIGQFILSFPILCGLTVTAVRSLDRKVELTTLSLGANPIQGLIMLLKEARFGIFAAVIAGFGRVFAEIGVSMMLGGNIRGYTRNITTTI